MKIEGPLPYLILLVAWLSVTVNYLIDAAGHTTNSNGQPARRWITHSVFMAPLWGGTVGLASIILPIMLLGLSAESGLVLLAAGLGVLAAFTHLFLDALTEGGIFYMRRRIALAHFRYNNILLNVAFVIISLVLVAGALFPANAQQ